jgi:cation transport ATPase
MSKSSVMRIAPGTDGVSIWSSEIFGSAELARVRDFLSRTFSVAAVDGVELRRTKSFGRIRYRAATDPAQIWKQLSRALTAPGVSSPLSEASSAPAQRLDAGWLYLDGSDATPTQISRVGDTLTTWRVRHHSDSTLQLWHPVLRNRRDLVFRLEEALAATFGVEDFRASALSARVSIRFDKRALTSGRLASELEKAWPSILQGVDRPPSRTRFVAAGGLLGLAFTGQFLVPALRPVAVAGVALYSSHNVVGAVKELTRGQIGLSAMYATGLGFMLIGGMPFASTVFAVLMQSWPQLAHQKIVRSQRRAFAGQRRRPAWARIPQPDGTDVEVSVDTLRKDDRIVVRSGDTVPVDGVVLEGSAAVVYEAPFSAERVGDKVQGDAIAAGAFVRDGSLTIRVERVGAATVASYVDSLLPHSEIASLPSSFEAERIANRNAKPALALSAASLLLTRTLGPSQALIRPDYATAPRLSAQLSAIYGIADGLQQGVLFRNPAALDRLVYADVYVIDDSARLEQQRIEVASVLTVKGVSVELVVGYALAARRISRSEQSRALAAFASRTKTKPSQASALARFAGVTRYRDGHGSAIEIATSRYLAASGIDVPASLQPVAQPRAKAAARHVQTDLSHVPHALHPIWVLRDEEVLGVISFERGRELIGSQVVTALKLQNKRARIVYASGGAEADAQAVADKLGIEFSRAGLRPAAKADLIRGLGRQTIWIGDGSSPELREPIAASTVSISVGALSDSRQDAADILLPQGLDALPELIELGRAHERRLADDYRAVYTLNLLGVAGALFARFNSLQAGLLSNVGTGLIYVRHARQLERLAIRAEAERAQLKRRAV